MNCERRKLHNFCSYVITCILFHMHFWYINMHTAPHTHLSYHHHHNTSSVTGGGMWGQWAKCPLILFTGKFLLTYWEKIGKGKREMREKNENCKREGGNGIWRVKRYENEQRIPPPHFWKPLNFILGEQIANFYQEI